MNYRFEWDDGKERINIRKHGIDFTMASTVFLDPLHQMVQDRIEGGEWQWQTIGIVKGQVVVLVAHTVVETDTMTCIRIISARHATKKEQEYYHGRTYH